MVIINIHIILLYSIIFINEIKLIMYKLDIPPRRFFFNYKWNPTTTLFLPSIMWSGCWIVYLNKCHTDTLGSHNITCSDACVYSLVDLLLFYYTSQQTQNICITFVQCRTNGEDVGPTLYKCYRNVLCLLGIRLINCRKIALAVTVFIIWYYFISNGYIVLNMFNPFEQLAVSRGNWFRAIHFKCRFKLCFWSAAIDDECPLKGQSQAKIIKKSVILFWLFNMTIWCKHVNKLELHIF